MGNYFDLGSTEFSGQGRRTRQLPDSNLIEGGWGASREQVADRPEVIVDLLDATDSAPVTAAEAQIGFDESASPEDRLASIIAAMPDSYSPLTDPQILRQASEQVKDALVFGDELSQREARRTLAGRCVRDVGGYEVHANFFDIIDNPEIGWYLSYKLHDEIPHHVQGPNRQLNINRDLRKLITGLAEVDKKVYLKAFLLAASEVSQGAKGNIAAVKDELAELDIVKSVYEAIRSLPTDKLTEQKIGELSIQLTPPERQRLLLSFEHEEQDAESVSTRARFVAGVLKN